MGDDYRCVFGPARITSAPDWIPRVPNHVRTVLTLLYALWLDPLRGRSVCARALSGVWVWAAGENIPCESHDLQRLGPAVLHLRCTDGGDQHEFGQRSPRE